MKSVALIIGPPGPGRSDIARTVAATSLFGRIVHSETEQQTDQMLRQHPVDIVCCAYPNRPTTLSRLLSKLRARDDWQDIPLLLFATDSRHINRIAALELGASDCLACDLSPREATVQIGWHVKNRHRIETLRRSESDLARKAVTDGLTGLFNRSYFDASLEQKLALAYRTERPLTLLLADLDHFKAVNDTYGHLAGDQALQDFAALLKQSARKSDIVCRYGGEEFAVILAECDSSQAVQAAERLRKRVAAFDFGMHLTVSIGLATTTGFHFNPQQLLEHADNALYRAKDQGRNRTELYGAPTTAIVESQIGLSGGGDFPRLLLHQTLRRPIAALRRVAKYSFGEAGS